MEAAFALLSLVAVLVVCAAGLTALSSQLRCIDAAREAARLAARGDARAAESARLVAPAGAVVQLRRDGELVVATVALTPVLLPGIRISARAVSALEAAA